MQYKLQQNIKTHHKINKRLPKGEDYLKAAKEHGLKNIKLDFGKLMKMKFGNQV